MLLEIMQKAPAFSLFDHKGVKHALSDYKDSFVLLYFYPKDFTPGCTTEACSIRDVHKELKKAGVLVLGVSLDDMDSHKKFIKEHKLPFTILTDEKLKMSEAYGALVTKDNGKKTTYSLSRISYLIDKKGKIVKVYAKVNPQKHAEQVLKDITSINEAIKLEEMAKRLVEKEKLAKKLAKEKAILAKEKATSKQTITKKAVSPTKSVAKNEKVASKKHEPVIIATPKATPVIEETYAVQDIIEIYSNDGETEVFLEEEITKIEE